MVGNQPAIAEAASFVVSALPGIATLSGSLLFDVSAAEIVVGRSASDNISLEHDSLVDAPVCAGGVQTLVTIVAVPLPIDWCWDRATYGIPCAANQPSGWNSVLASLPCSSVARLGLHLVYVHPVAVALVGVAVSRRVGR